MNVIRLERKISEDYKSRTIIITVGCQCKNGVDTSPIDNPVRRSRKRNVKINSFPNVMATSGTVQRRQSMRAGVFDESVEH